MYGDRLLQKHLKNIFEIGELAEQVVSSILEHTTQHGAMVGKTQTQSVKYYNLDAIIAVGYRVNSKLIPAYLYEKNNSRLSL